MKRKTKNTKLTKKRLKNYCQAHVFSPQTVLKQNPRSISNIAQGSGSVFNSVAPCLEGGNKKSIFQPSYHHVCSFILCFFSFVYSSIGFCHGEGRCPWRAAQQESISDG